LAALHRLPDADLTEEFEQRPFRRRHGRRLLPLVEGADMAQGIGLLVEQSLAVHSFS
jgi:hypothetical protein